LIRLASARALIVVTTGLSLLMGSVLAGEFGKMGGGRGAPNRNQE
jgi:hypothetical protein